VRLIWLCVFMPQNMHDMNSVVQHYLRVRGRTSLDFHDGALA
jgi:hypothetical protein